MACCPPRRNRETGYATPLAMVFALGLAMIVAAVLSSSGVELRRARIELERTRMDYALSGAQLMAVATMVRSGEEGPFRWSFSSEAGWVDALAEPEALKLGLDAASALSEAQLRGLGATQPAQVKAALAQGATEGTYPDIGPLGQSSRWRNCAASMISPFGAAETFTYIAPQAPVITKKPPAWRIGETWRLRLTTATGWRDERIVRFTGDARRPFATVRRNLTRGVKGEAGCDAILQAGA